MNTITVIGNVGQDPELKYTASGKPIAKFSVADTRGKDEAKQTQWHRVTVFDEQAEVVVEQVRKGARVLVTGRLQIDEYTDKDGNKRTSYDIVADDVCLSLRWRPRDGQTTAAVARVTDAFDGTEEEPF